MTLDLNASRLVGLFTPLWPLLGLSLWLNRDDWLRAPWWIAIVTGVPFAFVAAAWALGRRRWRLELTPTELIHHTLGRTERYAFARMGPVEVRGAPLPWWLGVRTLWFAYPLDEARGAEELASRMLGRRVLAVFGDGSAAETARIIEDWRRAQGASAPEA